MTLLIWLAVLPGLFLIFRVYRLDKIENEPIGLLIKLIILGAVIAVPVSFIEIMMDSFTEEIADASISVVFENFIGVALIEEFFKYIVLKSSTWKHWAFNYRFDAIVYSVCTSMGFAILENILYVTEYGLEIAIARMFISVPAHCIFAIYMGYYYGISKAIAHNSKFKSFLYRVLALWIPVLLHGFFDYTASLDSDSSMIAFLIFVILMDIFSIRRIKIASKSDFPI